MQTAVMRYSGQCASKADVCARPDTGCRSEKQTPHHEVPNRPVPQQFVKVALMQCREQPSTGFSTAVENGDELTCCRADVVLLTNFIVKAEYWKISLNVRQGELQVTLGFDQKI
jgi:hypothetical protein